MKTTEEKIAVMQAYLDGQQIEMSYITLPAVGWTGVEHPKWDWLSLDYRIKSTKPEPRSRFFVEWTDGSLSSSNFETEEEASTWASDTPHNGIYELKEVIE